MTSKKLNKHYHLQKPWIRGVILDAINNNTSAINYGIFILHALQPNMTVTPSQSSTSNTSDKSSQDTSKDPKKPLHIACIATNPYRLWL